MKCHRDNCELEWLLLILYQYSMKHYHWLKGWLGNYQIWATTRGHLSYLLLQKESTRQDSQGGRIQQIRQDNTSLIPCEAITRPGQISFKHLVSTLKAKFMMSNKWNEVLEAESISKCNQRLPFSSTPRKKVFSFGRRSSHRNCEKTACGWFSCSTQCTMYESIQENLH